MMKSQLSKDKANIDQDGVPKIDASLERHLHYLSAKELVLVKSAYETAFIAHYGQKRYSGDNYITHPVAVATILAAMQMDSHCIAAALLHDVIEDSEISIDDVKRVTDATTAKIVDGVTKIEHIEQETYAIKQAYNFQKMVLAMSNDVRVIAVKLADRLHNMRTLDSMPRSKQKTIAKETEEIYVGIARRLGMNDIAGELDDLGFCYQYPMRHYLITKAVERANVRNEDYLKRVENAIQNKLQDYNIITRVIGRKKSPVSIYKKMRGDRNKKAEVGTGNFKSFYKIMDIHGFRVIVSTVDDCYRALGALHQLYKPMSNRFKDYIASTKPNGYQSLHTTLLGPKNYPIEIQIRTESMNQYIEHGIAVHWLYKQAGKSSENEMLLKQNGWLMQLQDLQAHSPNPKEFLDAVKKDFYDQEIYVFTPTYNITALPRNASAIDFAYSVHTDIGNRAIGCRINGMESPLTTKLHNGQVVEIITGDELAVQANWLRAVVTSRATVSIKHHLAQKAPTINQKIDLVAIGKNLVRNHIRVLGLHHYSKRRLRYALTSLNTTEEEIFTSIGKDETPAFVFIKALYANEKNWLVPLSAQNSVQIPRCCYPLPEEKIMIAVSNRGLVAHARACHNIIRHKNKRELLAVEWPARAMRHLTPTYTTRIRMRVSFSDRGVSTTLANIITDSGALVGKVSSVDIDNSSSFFDVQLVVKHRSHLIKIMRQLKKNEHVHTVVRVR